MGLLLVVMWPGWPALLARKQLLTAGAILVALGPVGLLMVALGAADCAKLGCSGGSGGFDTETLLLTVVLSGVPLIAGLFFLAAARWE